MRIKEISCEQFAGLHDREFEFDKGLNLLIGENESGKSTLIDLMYQLFFHHATIKDNNTADKEFKDRYYPKLNGSDQPDYIEGTIRFETEEGRFKLHKEWLKNGTAKLTLPDGRIIRDESEIERILAEKLNYGKGVYDELVFASQRRPQTLLQGILGSGSESMDALASTITKAVMETGGIALDKVEKELSENVLSYEGHWDFATGLPEGGRKRGLSNQWKNNVGSILQAYYTKETIADSQKAAKAAEENVERINRQIRSEKDKLDQISQRRDRFTTVRSLLETQNANKQLLDAANTQYSEMVTAIQDWPMREAALKKAVDLKELLQLAQTKELFDKVSVLVAARDAIQGQIDQIGVISAEDVKAATTLEKDIPKLEGKLRGMNLSARIRRLGTAPVQIRSSVTGEPLEIDGEMADITEAVDISVPGVVEIQISPKGIDVDEVKKELDNKRGQLSEILSRYAVGSLEELREKQQTVKDLSSDLKDKEREIRSALGRTEWEELKAAGEKIPSDCKTVAEIEKEIQSLCDFKSVDSFIGTVSAVIDGYVRKYSTLNKLSQEKEAKSREIFFLKEKAENAAAIPEEFVSITDPDQYDLELRERIKAANEILDTLRDKLSDAEKAVGDKSAEEYAEELVQAEAEFEERKAEHARWKHIQEVFLRIKNNAKGNPLEDVERYFRDYLALLSNGSLALGSIDEDLGSSITSGDSQLSANILSDGTKDTISLAFRLAVLKHLFPEGGCVAVFDDPFTDMDPKRTAQACRIIEEFARENQVIFVSCDDKYTKYMSGNVIRIAR